MFGGVGLQSFSGEVAGVCFFWLYIFRWGIVVFWWLVLLYFSEQGRSSLAIFKNDPCGFWAFGPIFLVGG